MLFQQYLFTVNTRKVIVKEGLNPKRFINRFIVYYLRQEGYNVKIYGRIKCFEECGFYPENTTQIVMCCSGQSPPDLDRFLQPLKRFIILDCIPMEFTLTEDEIIKYFHSDPMIFLLSQYQTDYSKYNLNVQWLQSRYPELYEKLVGPELCLKF